MLLVITFAVIMVVGLILLWFYERSSYGSDSLGYTGTAASFIGFFCIAVSVVIIIISHACPERQIASNSIKRDGIIKKVEILRSDYEDISKTSVIEEVTNWNRMVTHEKYGIEDPWLSWFHCKKVVDQLEYIDI